MTDVVTIHGVEYAPIKKHKRAIVVVDRGWIFAGDVEEKEGRIYLRNAVWVFRWQAIGFSAVITNPEKADIRVIDDVDIPEWAEIFRVPVPEGWGRHV